MNIRALAESDLKYTLEDSDGYGKPVILISPDGERIDTNQNTGEPLTGQVLYDTVRMDADSGADVITEEPIITLRRSSLSRVPKSGELWFIQIPGSPLEGAPLVNYQLDKSKAIQGGRSIGFIRLYPKKAEQK